MLVLLSLAASQGTHGQEITFRSGGEMQPPGPPEMECEHLNLQARSWLVKTAFKKFQWGSGAVA